MNRSSRLRSWQTITLVVLFVGYVGYYVCRSNVAVAAPIWLGEFKSLGLTKTSLGWMQTVGVLMYALGKVVNGPAIDYFGGRRFFLLGMFGSAICTLGFAFFLPPAASTWGFAGLMTALIGLWGINRYFQSIGWGAIVKVSSRWYPAAWMASIMGILSLSFLLGDWGAKKYLGVLLDFGFDWRSLFYVAAGTLAAIGVLTFFLLRGSPADIDEPEPAADESNVYGREGERPEVVSFRQLVLPLLRSVNFWVICALSLGLTMIRETFQFWLPTYLYEVAQLNEADAAQNAAWFPFVGAGVALVAGLSSDLVGKRHGRIMVPLLIGLVGALIAMGIVPLQGRAGLVVGLTCLVSALLIAPYTFCAGVMAVDLGGKKGSSTAAGLIDAAGYIGAALSGVGIGALADIYGWSSAFLALAVVAGLTTAAAVVYWVRNDFVLRASQ